MVGTHKVGNTSRGTRSTNAGLQLLKCLWEEVLNQNDWTVTNLIRKPSHVLFVATEVGNSEFLEELVGAYPDLVWEIDDCNRSLFHNAVMYHHATIFNMVHQLGLYKDFILSYKDDKNNNILHLAAKLAPPNQLNTVSGAALQMQRELLWFEVSISLLLLYISRKEEVNLLSYTDIYIVPPSCKVCYVSRI